VRPTGLDESPPKRPKPATEPSDLDARLDQELDALDED